MYRHAACCIVDDPRPDEDKRAPSVISQHGLWTPEDGGHPGLSVGISALPPNVLQGIDHSGDPDQPPPNAWRQLCTPSPARFTQARTGWNGHTIAEMADVPDSYGTWDELRIIS